MSDKITASLNSKMSSSNMQGHVKTKSTLENTRHFIFVSLDHTIRLSRLYERYHRHVCGLAAQKVIRRLGWIRLLVLPTMPFLNECIEVLL